MPGRKGNRQEASPAHVRATIDTQRRAAELRAAGASYREIGKALNIDHTWARALVLRALNEVTVESADLMRAQEGQRLDRLQRAAWTQAIGGNLKAIAEVRRLMRDRATLFGLDAAHDLAERELALAERQGAMLAQGVVTLLTNLGLGDDPTARAHAAAMLADLGRRELESGVLDVEVIEEDDVMEGVAL